MSDTWRAACSPKRRRSTGSRSNRIKLVVRASRIRPRGHGSVFIAHSATASCARFRHFVADSSTVRKRPAWGRALLPDQSGRGARPTYREWVCCTPRFNRRVESPPISRELSLRYNTAQTTNCGRYARREEQGIGLHQGCRVLQSVCGCGCNTGRDGKRTDRLENQGWKNPQTA
jgi:hypothetical protein